MDELQSLLLSGDDTISHPIISRLLQKKRLLSKGDNAHKKIKTALVIGGGGMRGTFGAGVVTGLEKIGLNNVFDIAVGVSAGAADIAYFLANQAELGTKLWYEEAASPAFIKKTRITKFMDANYINHMLRVAIPLNVRRIKNSRSDFFIGVTNVQTGKEEYIDAQMESVDIVEAVVASSAMPIAYNRTVQINGSIYADGSVGVGIPVELAFKKNCTDILVVLNSTVEQSLSKSSIFEKFLAHIYMKDFNDTYKNATLRNNENMHSAFEAIIKASRNINIGIICPKRMPISKISRDRRKIKEVALDAEQMVSAIFN